MTQAPKILVFDSGVGGLSILLEVQRQLPHCHYSYACDNEAFPYGTKPQDQLVNRVDKVLQHLNSCISPDIVVVACNTASTVALPRIRDHFTNPVVGVVPAIKPAAIASNSKTIGLLGTPGTVARNYTNKLIEDFAQDCQVIKVGSSELVEMAEQKLRGGTVDLQELSSIMAPFFDNSELDTIVLACTHFPLMLEELNRIAPRTINWVDSGNAIARRVDSLLAENLSEQSTAKQSAKQSIQQSTKGSGFHCLMTAKHPDNNDLLLQLTEFGCTQMDVIKV